MEFKKNKKKFSLKDKEKVGSIALMRKRQFEEDKKDPVVSKSYWNAKRKKWINPMTQKGFIGPSVREIFVDMNNEPESTKDFRSCYKFVTRCLELKVNGAFDTEGNTSASHYRVGGAGPPPRALEVRQALFEYFIDIRSSLKGRLPVGLFLSKAKSLYNVYVEEKEKLGEEPQKLNFSQKWFSDWCKSYCVSVKAPNKRFSISADDRKIRIIDLVKNVWTVRYFFIKNYGVDPPIIGSDQMPLHRNEVSSEKTMNFSGATQSTFVKENHKLSRERTTVMTTISSSKSVKPPPLEFVFKGKGTRVKLNPPENVTVQWADKGSYRLDNMLRFIASLPNVPIALFPKLRQIFLLDDYSVHLDPSLEEKLHKKGYFLVIIGGGITGDVQGNDTHYHRSSKRYYREAETRLMIQQLDADKTKIPAPSRDDMMNLFNDAWTKAYAEIDCESVFKQNMLTIKMDGSEDHLVSRRLWDLVGEEISSFRAKLLKSTPSANIRALRKSIIPPKGVKRKALNGDEQPEDEGVELYDGDDYFENFENVEEINSENEDDEENEENGEGIDNNDDDMMNEVEETELEGLKDVKFLDDVSSLLSTGRENCSKELLPYLVKMENIVKIARRKSLKASSVNQAIKRKITEIALEHREVDPEDIRDKQGTSKTVIEVHEDDQTDIPVSEDVDVDDSDFRRMSDDYVSSTEDEDEHGKSFKAITSEYRENENVSSTDDEDEHDKSFKAITSEYRENDDESDGNVFDMFQ